LLILIDKQKTAKLNDYRRMNSRHSLTFSQEKNGNSTVKWVRNGNNHFPERTVCNESIETLPNNKLTDKNYHQDEANKMEEGNNLQKLPQRRPQDLEEGEEEMEIDDIDENRSQVTHTGSQDKSSAGNLENYLRIASSTTTSSVHTVGPENYLTSGTLELPPEFLMEGKGEK
jgi:hypothetical protein